MSNREILKHARAEVVAGRDRQAVFATYQAQVKQPLHLARIIASVPRPELKRRWQIPNWILVGLLGLAALFKTAYLFQSFAEGSIVLAVGISALGVLVPLAFAVEVARFNGQIYGLLGFMCVLGFLQVLTHYHGDTVAAAVDTSFILVILTLSLCIKAKVFPNLGFSGTRRDPAGQFIL